jgi:hypothetical protein
MSSYPGGGRWSGSGLNKHGNTKIRKIHAEKSRKTSPPHDLSRKDSGIQRYLEASPLSIMFDDQFRVVNQVYQNGVKTNRS